jgi:hypothetical protein
MEHTDAIERVRVAMIERVIVPSAETARNSTVRLANLQLLPIHARHS